MHRNTFFRSAQWGSFVVSLFLGTLLVLPLSILQTGPINLNQLSCQVDASEGDKTFRIYTPSDWQAEAMAAFSVNQCYREATSLGLNYLGSRESTLRLMI